MTINVSGIVNSFRLLFRPSLCLPHHSVATFNDLPSSLEDGLRRDGHKAEIRAVILDKDDCFAWPHSTEVFPAYKARFAALREQYPSSRLLIVSNTAGCLGADPDGSLARQVEEQTGVEVLRHRVRKPGCGGEIMAHLRSRPDSGVSRPDQLAVVGDRLLTDVLMANMMGSWAFWLRDGVVPLAQKSLFARWERSLADVLRSRNFRPPSPETESPFES